MNDEILIERLNHWKAMPDFIRDVRDFQRVKTRPYLAEIKSRAFEDLYAQATDKQRRALFSIFEPGEYSAVYAQDAFLDFVLDSTPDEAATLLQIPFVNTFRADNISRYSETIEKDRDPRELQKGLLAAVLTGYNDDYRDVLMALATLWISAARVGIDPLPYFQEASGLASDADLYGWGSVKNMLHSFHKSAIFKEQVEPNLPSPPTPADV